MSLRVLYEQKSQEIYCVDCRGGRGKLKCEPHLHRELELVIFYGEETVAYADSVKCKLRTGDIFLSFPNQIHFYDYLGGVEKYLLIIFKPDLLAEFSELFANGIPRSPVIRGGLNLPYVAELADKLAVVSKSAPGPYQNTMKRGLLLAILSMIVPKMQINRFSIGNSDAMRSIITYCMKHYSEDLSLSVLEERLHLNKYYISHLFSGKLGLRFNDYVNSLRISEACRYLLNSSHSITEISEIVGFNNLRTFNRAFIKQIGVSPSEYRRDDTLTVRNAND